MKLVEVVRTILTDAAAVTTAVEWVRAVGEPFRRRIRPRSSSTGYWCPTCSTPSESTSGLATLEDIDAAMKLGCGYPMGPFTLLDLVGLDTAMYVAEVMFEEFREPRYAPPPLLKRMVGRALGRKTGQGFYRYS